LVNRSQLLRTVSDRTGMARKEVEQVYEHTIQAIADSVRKGEKVALSGFGAFRQRVTKARKAGMQKNPFTGEMVKVAARPAKKQPKFVPAKQFKEYVAGSLKAMPGATKTGPAKKAAKKTTARAGAARKGAKKAAKKAAKRR
jgi:DNA-binding protein HU-beta